MLKNIPKWFEYNINYSQLESMSILIDRHSPESLGVDIMLKEYLATQEGYRANVKVIPGLIRRFNTRQSVMEDVVFNSGLYELEKKDNIGIFFSPNLNEALLSYGEFLDKQKEKAIKSVESREQQRVKHINEIENILSVNDSSKPHYTTLQDITLSILKKIDFSKYPNLNRKVFDEWLCYKNYSNKMQIVKVLDFLNSVSVQEQNDMVSTAIIGGYPSLVNTKLFKKQKNNKQSSKTPSKANNKLIDELFSVSDLSSIIDAEIYNG